MQSIFLALVLAANPPAVPEEQQRPPAVPLMPPAVPVKPSVAEPAGPTEYSRLAEMAASQKRPFVVFVGMDARPISGAVVCQAESLAGHPDPRIVVSVPANGWLAGKATLAATATDADIQQAIRPAVSPQAAAPFAERDADLSRGPWPAKLDFPAGMERYRRARFTQSIVVSDGRDSITPVHRSQLEAKWRQSGGTLGLTFRSDVYRNDKRPQTWVDNIQVFNGSNFQPNRGYVRQYPDGARFLDVLSVGGKVFEIRSREKVRGRWDYAVTYEDADARPAGYVSVSLKACASCHAESGSGGYGAGLVPGGDETISDPIPQLER